MLQLCHTVQSSRSSKERQVTLSKWRAAGPCSPGTFCMSSPAFMSNMSSWMGSGSGAGVLGIV